MVREDPEYLPDAEKLTRRMSHLTTLKKRFWKKWKLEYLQELREHHRSLSTSPGVARELQENEPVVIYDQEASGDWGGLKNSSGAQMAASEQPE